MTNSLPSRLYFILIVNILSEVTIADLKGFDDTVLFKINWPGKDAIELLVSRLIFIVILAFFQRPRLGLC